MTRSLRAARQTTGVTGWKGVLLRVRGQVRDDNVSLLSAGVAFYSMLSIFPALIALISIYGLVAEHRTEAQPPAGAVGERLELAGQRLPRQLEAHTHSAGRGLSLGAV